METEYKTTKIVLSRTILPQICDFSWNFIPAGTELIFDEDGVTSYNGINVYLNRIHKECIENPSQYILDNYYPDKKIHENDEILACDEVLTDRLITSSFGEVAIRRYAYGIKESISLAYDYDSSKNWQEIINQKNLDLEDSQIFSAIIEHRGYLPNVLEYRNYQIFIIANKKELVFRLLSYGLSLHPNEICLQDTITGALIKTSLQSQNTVEPIKYGRGLNWVREEIKSLPELGRDGLPPEVILPTGNETVCVLCELCSGHRLISPIGQAYGLELFCFDIYKDTDIFHRCESGWRNIPSRNHNESNTPVTPLRYMHTKIESPSPYGYGSPAPFSLYQDKNDKWGLVDRNGVMLPAIFTRIDDYFYSNTHEAVSFDPENGFELVSWFDPDEF